MGASGWEYVTPFKGTVEESLKALHAQVFEEEYGDDDTYGSLAELWEDEEFMGEEGTHTILDIDRVVHTTAAPSDRDVQDYGTLRPLAPDRVRHHFGTEHPTPDQFQDAVTGAYASLAQRLGPGDTLLDECRMRWTGLYVVLHTGTEPTHLGIFGFSGD
ncbi:hypothetical protein [Streptomyces justiciae]|uniref:Uncharacterized protein n=1 Tax=Streptomyces justiciae TaxID=2780140 RepID=A0ABU3LPC1_9ACTN|nr:hypothetical protein [Streptomyces justiciae]MDT7840453.1 hypothetical protein [Streptomyces justiciae]